jgi:hypothetical protein
VVLAGAFALLGPVALATWWVIGSHAGAFSGLPGFFSDWAPTVGDAALLTMLVALVRSAFDDLDVLRGPAATSDARPPSFAGIGWAIAPFAIAFATVAAVHVQWLTNPAIVPNWTLPRAGTLAGPGWLHAAFVTFVLYWLLAFAARAFVVVRHIQLKTLTPDGWEHFELLRERIGAVSALLAAFAALLYIDNYGYTLSLTTLSRSWSTVGVLVLAAGVVAAPSVWFAGRMRAARDEMPRDVGARQALAAVAPWLTVLIAPGVVALAWIAERVARTPMIAAAAAVLGVVAIGAAWFDIYHLHRRRTWPSGAVVMAAALLAVESGYVGAVLAVESAAVPIERFTSLPEILWLPPLVSLAGAAAAFVMLRWLLGREEALKKENLTKEPASGNLLQNAAQFLGLLQLVVLPVAFLSAGRIVSGSAVHTMQDLLLSGIGPAAYIPLLFSYFGVVTFGLGFSLNNSWKHLGGLEKEGHPSARRVKTAIMFMSLGSGLVAGMAFFAMWIGTLASFIGMAKI